MKFIALMDDFGQELNYIGYSRQRAPHEDDWEVVQFAAVPEPITVIGMWICEGETSRMRDGDYCKFDNPITFQHGERPNIHMRGFK